MSSRQSKSETKQTKIVIMDKKTVFLPNPAVNQHLIVTNFWSINCLKSLSRCRQTVRITIMDQVLPWYYWILPERVRRKEQKRNLSHHPWMLCLVVVTLQLVSFHCNLSRKPLLQLDLNRNTHCKHLIENWLWQESSNDKLPIKPVDKTISRSFRLLLMYFQETMLE